MPRRQATKFAAILVLYTICGCAAHEVQPEYAEVEHNLESAIHRPPQSIPPHDPAAVALDPAPVPAELEGKRPVDDYIRRAIHENRNVQAAWANVQAMRERIPQAVALEDPMFQNVIWPVPSISPQYSIMGYMPYDTMITQSFPWFGTLRLRGQVADQDAKVAIAELAAAELETVAEVKRAYYDLHYAEKSLAILNRNRDLAEQFVEISKERVRTGGNAQDVYRAQIGLEELQNEITQADQSLKSARAALAEQLHISPEAELGTIDEARVTQTPKHVDELYRLAAAARPELQGRLSAIARDRQEVELAKKRYYPNFTLGLTAWAMERNNAASTTLRSNPNDNFGMVFNLNLPIYRNKLDAGLREAQFKAVADSRKYDADRDKTYREIKELFVQIKAQREILAMFEQNIYPKSKQALDLASTDYEVAKLDFLSLITAWRGVLQVELQIARFEAEIGKAVASLERVVGCEVNEHPNNPDAVVPPAEGAGPFAKEAKNTAEKPSSISSQPGDK